MRAPIVNEQKKIIANDPAPAAAAKSSSSAADASSSSRTESEMRHRYSFNNRRQLLVELDNIRKYTLSTYQKPLQEVEGSLDLENRRNAS